MILRAAIAAAAVLALLLVVQTYRLGNCQAKAKRLETCQEVNKIEKDVSNETDDGLADSISGP